MPPADLLRIDLGRFNPELAGYAIYGRIAEREFVPYYSRRDIDSGALAGRGLELLWVDDPVDKFFLQIQGSGQVRLDDGSLIRVGYAGQNGQPYRAIGRDLIEMGVLTPEQVSMQAIRAWLEAHPNDAPQIMARNRSYIFFEERPELAPDEGPLGAQGVSLTAGRSLAVDPPLHPVRRAGLAGHHRALAGGRRPAAPAHGRPGYRRRDQGRGARRRVLGGGRARRSDRRPHEEPRPLCRPAAEER